MKRKPIVVIAATVVTLAMFGQTSQSDLMAQVTVFDNQIDFVSASGATLVPIPDSDTAFPATSCGGAPNTGSGDEVVILFDTNSLTLTQDLTAPGNTSRGICIFDDLVERAPANTDPNVMDGNTIVGNGEDDYLVVFDEPVHAVGFRLLTNFCADEVVTLSDSDGAQISAEDIDGLTGTNTRQFVGFKSSTAIKSLVIDTCNGHLQNEGIDEIKLSQSLCSTDLIAGGGNPNSGVNVGEVSLVHEGGGLWDVTYETTNDWRILELHLALGCGEGDIPQTKKGNPIPGQFPYKWYPDPPDAWAQSVTFEDVSPPNGCDCVTFAAHAVVIDLSVCDPREALVFGTERGVNNGDAFLIDLAGGTATSVFDTTPTPTDQNQPNGNAFDAANNRLYYSAVTPEDNKSVLYFVDFDDAVLTETIAGTLGGFVAGASFFDSKYYYIENRTDDVRAVSFNPDGTAASDVVVISDFTGSAGETFRFGDIVINAYGVLFGSAQVLDLAGVLRNEFFKIDLDTSTYMQIQDFPRTAGTRQLAFGSDGTLYGHNAGTGDFFTIDPATGNETSIGTVTGSSTGQFTDLASVPLCNPLIETAWGDGMDFFGRNWATYFECGECNGAASGVR